MRVSREGIDEIKRRNDLAEVVTEHGIELKRRGKTLFGICPFHEEKTASFAISREAGLFHCFGCGVGGDVIGFVVRFHRISFRDALTRLAARAGVRLGGLVENGETLRSHGQSGLAQGDGLEQASEGSDGLRRAMARRLHEKAAVRFAWLALHGRQS
jgi:DNA primase